MIPVILSGGSGSRLWPLSRESYPKQFLPLTSEQSMLCETLCRLNGLEELSQPIVVCNEQHRFLVAEQLRGMHVSPQAIVLEPEGRNTAPAVAIAALAALEQAKNALMLVLPADHVIEDIATFHQSLYVAKQAAQQGKLVTFGIVPTAPETGYGYIKSSESYEALKDLNALVVEQFVEKPDAVTAESYLISGDYFWNSGMFMFEAGTFLAELEKHNPEMLNLCQQAFRKAARDMDFVRLDENAFKQINADSIDYAVMEKTDQAVVVPLDAGWNDIGSWSALSDNAQHDTEGNVTDGDVMLEDSNNCYVRSEHRLVVVLGIHDQIIVETSDAVIVMPKDKAQEVTNIAERLKKDQFRAGYY